MSRAELERATDRFFRANKARSRAAGGAGLGLSITKDLITALGGRLELESEEGVGTVARLRLPVPSEGIVVPSVEGRATQTS
jgi:signal transduction histidine kinase